MRMKNPQSLEHKSLCELRLNELSREDLANLTEFAERSLVAMGRNPWAGEDATQHALAAILRGLESDRGGRQPRPVDVANKDSFLNFVRGAISSTLEAMSRKRQFRIEHTGLEEDMASIAVATTTPATQAELDDLRDQLFLRLRDRAPQRLQRTLDAWERVFTESDRIPAPGHRLYVGEVRDLAKEVVSELGGIR